MTALVPNISKEILCRPTWVIQILLFKLIFPFLLGCHMAICHTFLTIALACFEGIWFTCFGYILHLFGSLSTMFWVLNISFDMTFPFVTSHFAPGMWIFGFYSPLLIFFKIVLEIKGCSLFMSVAYTWVFTFLVGERFQRIYHCDLSCKTNPIIITYLYQESKLIWRN